MTETAYVEYSDSIPRIEREQPWGRLHKKWALCRTKKPKVLFEGDEPDFIGKKYRLL